MISGQKDDQRAASYRAENSASTVSNRFNQSSPVLTISDCFYFPLGVLDYSQIDSRVEAIVPHIGRYLRVEGCSVLTW